MKVTFITTIITLFLLISPCLAQRANQIIIYSNKSDFLVPFIKTTLEEMVDNKTGQKLISKATNLNLLFVNTNADKLLRSNLDYNFPDKSFDILKDEKLKDSILDVLVTNDYFLLVNENILLDQIEFQLVLYKISKDTLQNVVNKKNFPFKNLIRPISENNFFVDIKSANYLEVLKNGVKKLLPNSNYIPRFYPFLKGNVNKLDSNRFAMALNDTSSLVISNIYDEDNPVDQIKFKLKILSLDGVNENEYALYDYKKNEFKLQLNKVGKSKLIVTADDGISISSDTIYLEVVEIPKIIALHNNFEFIYSAFARRELIKNIAVPVYIKGIDPKFIFESTGHRIIKNENQQLLDSLIHTSTNKRVFKLNNLISNDFESYYRLEKYGQNVKKISEGLYLIELSTNEIDDESFSIYGVSNGLKSNTVSINIKDIFMFPGTVKYGLERNVFEISFRDTVKGTFNYNVFNYVNLNFRLISLRNNNVGISMTQGKLVESVFLDKKLKGVKSLGGPSASYGVYYSTLLHKKDFIFDFNGGLTAKSLPLQFDTLPIYDVRRIYYTYGAKIELVISSIKFKGLGLFIGGGFSTANHYGIRHDQASFGFGLSYNPLSTFP